MPITIPTARPLQTPNFRIDHTKAVEKTAGTLGEWFPYKTAKTVYINDSRIGILTFVCKSIIFIYIIMWQLLHNKQYLKCEAPAATLLSSLRWPEQLASDTCASIGSSIAHGSVEGERWYQPSYDYCSHGDRSHHSGGSQTRTCTTVHDAHEMLIAESPNFIQLLVTELAISTDSLSTHVNSEYIYTKGVEELLVDFDLTLLSPSYVEDGMVDNTMGGSALNVELALVDENDNIVEMCLENHKDDFDITETCYQRDPFESSCKFEVREKFSIPYRALMAAAGIPSTGLSTLIDDFDGMHDQCVKAFMHGITESNFSTLKSVNYSSGLVPELGPFADYDAFHDDIEELCSEETLRDFHLKLFVSIEYDNLSGSNARFGGPYDSDVITAKMRVTKHITAAAIFEETSETSCSLVLKGSDPPDQPCPSPAPPPGPSGCEEKCNSIRPDEKGQNFTPYNLRSKKEYKLGTTIKVSHSGQLCQFSLLATISLLNNSLVLLALSSVLVAKYIKILPEKDLYASYLTEKFERPAPTASNSNSVAPMPVDDDVETTKGKGGDALAAVPATENEALSEVKEAEGGSRGWELEEIPHQPAMQHSNSSSS